MKYDAYKIVSEIVTGHPNYDMLITKSYLYVYIEKDKMDAVKQNGISAGSDNTISAYFVRLPESQYPEYLKTHVPVKISVAKLGKIKDQDVKVKPVNIQYSSDSLDEEDVQKILKNASKKILSLFKDRTDITRLPRADIIVSTTSKTPARAAQIARKLIEKHNEPH
jgi:hypothetical protein